MATVAVGLTIASAMPAAAQGFGEMIQRYRPPPKGVSDTYIVTLSGTGGIEPRYPGADSGSGVFFPSLSYRRSDEPARFTATDDGASISIFDDPSFRFGPVFRFDSGRYFADDHRKLFGLRKLDYDVESGLFLEYWPLTFIRARIEARHGFRDDSGFAGTGGVDFVLPYDRFTFSVGPRFYLGDDKYTNRFFGVTPAEAALNRRVFAYRPKGGLTGVGGLGAITYQWNETWATTGFVGYKRLVDDAGDSPIATRIGSKDQVTVGVKISYSFSYKPSSSGFLPF